MHLYCDQCQNMQCSFKYFEQCIKDLLDWYQESPCGFLPGSNYGTEAKNVPAQGLGSHI